MKTAFIFIVISFVAAGCASMTEGGLPAQASPFSGDRPVRWPEAQLGRLEVAAFPRNPRSTQAGNRAAWRIYDVNGHPLGAVRREDATVPLPAGDYVIMAKDEHGQLHTAQVVIQANALTRLPMATASQTEGNALNDDKLEE